jgi:threonine synthase
LGDFLVLEGIYSTGGCAISVSDQELLDAEHLVAGKEGVFICPEGAATLAAAKKLLDEGWIKSDETVVALNTGTGLKYPETVSLEPPLLQPEDNI